MYGSWNDAHEYCMERNSTLFTLQPSLAGHLMDLVNVAEHGWKQSEKHFFAGLQCTKLVCTLMKYYLYTV